jgi:hypothetical protein
MDGMGRKARHRFTRRIFLRADGINREVATMSEETSTEGCCAKGKGLSGRGSFLIGLALGAGIGLAVYLILVPILKDQYKKASGKQSEQAKEITSLKSVQSNAKKLADFVGKSSEKDVELLRAAAAVCEATQDSKQAEDLYNKIIAVKADDAGAIEGLKRLKK